MLKKIRFTFLIVTISYLIIVSVLSLITFSTNSTISSFPHLDKIIHFVFYFGMNVLILSSIILYRKQSNSRLFEYIIATIITVSYSGLIEYIQPLVGRAKDYSDLIANSLGAMTGLIIFILLSHIYKDKIEHLR